MFINPAFAQATATAATGSSMSGMIVQLVLIFAIFYILLIRPQQKKMKEHEAKLNAIKKGDTITIESSSKKKYDLNTLFINPLNLPVAVSMEKLPLLILNKANCKSS